MKRFRECDINCFQGIEPIKVLDEIENICKSVGLKVERYKTWVDNDSMKVKYEKSDLPSSYVIIACPEGENNVSICNIVPSEENPNSRIVMSDYNKILGLFYDEVVSKIESGNQKNMKITSEDYNLSDVIPNSIQKLDIWLSAYPFSGHPLDEHRWYDFLLAYSQEDNMIDTGILREYIQEKRPQTTEKELESVLRKFEEQMDLLNYIN